MNNTVANADFQNEKIDAAQEWLYHNGASISGIEHKLNAGQFQADTMVLRRNPKRKDEGHLEIICGWFAEHQIGN